MTGPFVNPAKVQAFHRQLDAQQIKLEAVQHQRAQRLAVLDQLIGKCMVCGALVLPPALMRRAHECGRRLAA